jgi:hypothetical protein
MSAAGLWKRKKVGKTTEYLKSKECDLEDRRSEVYPKNVWPKAQSIVIESGKKRENSQVEDLTEDV